MKKNKNESKYGKKNAIKQVEVLKKQISKPCLNFYPCAYSQKLSHDEFLDETRCDKSIVKSRQRKIQKQKPPNKNVLNIIL